MNRLPARELSELTVDGVALGIDRVSATNLLGYPGSCDACENSEVWTYPTDNYLAIKYPANKVLIQEDVVGCVTGRELADSTGILLRVGDPRSLAAELLGEELNRRFGDDVVSAGVEEEVVHAITLVWLAAYA